MVFSSRLLLYPEKCNKLQTSHSQLFAACAHRPKFSTVYPIKTLTTSPEKFPRTGAICPEGWIMQNTELPVSVDSSVKQPFSGCRNPWNHVNSQWSHTHGALCKPHPSVSLSIEVSLTCNRRVKFSTEGSEALESQIKWAQSKTRNFS